MDKKFTYVSLFSSAGVGCYGFKLNGFDCVVTNELIERRLNVQKYNRKCKYETGYIQGDITDDLVKKQLFDEIESYKQKENILDIDVVIATPPCQGMSVANHKKTNIEIKRNSLVVEAINMIKKITPKFFVFENVQAFMNTACYDNGVKKKISQAIAENIADTYEYTHKVLNFKSYGANSSRTRTLVIGVRKDLLEVVSPIDLFPHHEKEKTLKELIYHLPRFTEMGDISDEDIYHGYRAYAPHMRNWISDLKEGESAFDNIDPLKKPHQVKNGEIITNTNKNGDKYKRQYWNKVAPCIHTRNDILASQNTIHPEDDRVFSIRELMILMNIPQSFKWVPEENEHINKMPKPEKLKFLKKHEINIRQSIGEAVPTIIMQKVACNIKRALNEKNPDDKELRRIIDKESLSSSDNLQAFIKANKFNYSLNALSRISELANTAQNETAAYYTDKNTLNIIYSNLPTISKDEIKVLEPSVGTGNFIPFIIGKYGNCKRLIIDVCDIDKNSLATLDLLIEKMRLPKNVIINYINDDFLAHEFNDRYDLVIGNPPFIKLKEPILQMYREQTKDYIANNSAAFFLEKAYTVSDYVVMIQPKYFLHNSDFKLCRERTAGFAIKKIVDFGEKGFKGVLIETICIFVSTIDKKGTCECISITREFSNFIKQNLLCDSQFPNWLLYRNDFFENICKCMKFGIFNCYRDRQITNKYLKPDGEVRVLKSRNILIDGSGIQNIEGYDSYLDKDCISNFSVSKYYDRDDVYLSPNMTYYPRVIKKPKNVLVNGSVAILELKDGETIEPLDLQYFASEEFREFYAIARNLSTRSLNLDNASIYYFGKKEA